MLRASHQRNNVRTTRRRHLPGLHVNREYTDRSFLETLNEHEAKREFMNHFLEDSETSTPSWDTQAIRRFCRSKTQTETVRRLPEIRLDDRQHDTDNGRPYPKTIPVVDLSQYLEIRRFGAAHLPDADHRRLWIQDIDPDCIEILAKTAQHHQVDVLRDTITRHISRAATIEVRERVTGFPTPCLQLHLPYLKLSETAGEDYTCSADNRSQLGKWSILPSSESNAKTIQQSDRFVIHSAQISIVLSIWDYSKWTAYGFSTPGHCRTLILDSDDEAQISDDDDADEAEELAPREDILAPENLDHDLYEEQSIQDPRRYFLRVIDAWISLILREYNNLVHTLETHVKTWRDEQLGLVFDTIKASPIQDGVSSLNDMIKSQQLIRFIQEKLSSAIEAWKDFSQSQGDIMFFKDLEDQKGRVALKNVRSSFRELVKLNKILRSLAKICKEVASDLKLRLDIESKLAIQESNFLNHKSNQLNFDTNAISHKISELNRQNTETARNTSRMTRNNVILFGLTTPLLVALQYFGADQPIFPSFDRNPRNFSIFLFVAGLIFTLFLCFLNYMDDMKDVIVSRFCPNKILSPIDA